MIGFRIDDEDEVAGIDLAEHAETAYELGNSGGGGMFSGNFGGGTVDTRSKEEVKA